MSETYTFRSIFSKPISYAKDEDPIVISKVIIPRIQRPYAQGRLGEAETKIRNSFLKDIFSMRCNAFIELLGKPRRNLSKNNQFTHTAC